MPVAVAGIVLSLIVGYQAEPTDNVAPPATEIVTAATTPAPDSPRPQETVRGEDDYRHIRNGHKFLPSYTLGSPFMDSRVTLVHAFGLIKRDLEIREIEFRELELVGITPAIDANVRLWKGLGIGVGAVGNIVTGTNRRSVGIYGASTATVGRASLGYQIIDSDRAAATLSVDLLKPKRMTLSPLGALAAKVRSLTGGGNPDTVSDETATLWRPAFRFAYAFTPAFGVQGDVSWVYNYLHEGEDNANFQNSGLNAGIGLSTNLEEWIKLPVGLTLNYQRKQSLDEGDSVNIGTVGLYETVRPWMSFGIEGGVARTEDINTRLAAFILRAYYE